MSIGLLRWYFPNNTFRRAANQRLRESFPDAFTQVWRSACSWQSQLVQKRPSHSTSVNLMIRYAEWCCAVYHAVQEHGMSQTNSGAFIESIMSDAYRPVPAAMFKLSRLRSAKRETRVRWLLGMITRYFFTSPFVHQHLPSEKGVAFDVTVCPFADYFKDQGVPELTPHAACNLDYGAAREMGVDLVRTQTITDEDSHCDFRWNFKEKERS